MLPVPSDGSLIFAYILAILTLVLQTAETLVQYRFGKKRSNYLWARFVLLVVILGTDAGLIYLIEVDKSKEGARWVPAIWALVQSSMLLQVFLETLLFLGICDGLDQDRGSRKVAYIVMFPVILIILICTILANVFALAFPQTSNQTAIVCQALGCFSSHMFASLFPIWVLGHKGNLLKRLGERRSWGMLVCSVCSFLAAGASLGLVGLQEFYSKFLGALGVMFASSIPWTLLQFYKLRKVHAAAKSTERSGIGMMHIPPVIDHELQVGSNRLVSEIDDLEACNKVVSWGQDSFTTFGEPPGRGGDGQEI